MSDTKQVVLDFFAAGEAGDMDRAFSLVADDVRWTNIGTTKYSGTFSGKQSLMEDLIGPLFSALEAGIQSRRDRIIAEGDIVVVQSQGTARTRSGVAYNNSYCQVMRIADGKIAEVTEYMDTALVDAVFGRAESD